MYYFFLLILNLQAKVSLMDVKQSAEKHHPTILSALQNVDAKEQAIRASQGYFDAKITGDHFRVAKGYWARTFSDVSVEKPLKVMNSKIYTGYSYGFNGLFPPQFSTWSTNSGGTPRVGLVTSLLRNRSTDQGRTQLALSKIDHQITKNELSLTVWEIQKLAEISYWDYLTSIQIYRIYNQLYENGIRRSSYLKSRSDRGDSPRILLTENEQYVANRKSNLLQSENRLNQARQRLSLYYRDQNGLPLIVSDQEEVDQFPESLSFIENEIKGIDYDQIIEKRPEISSLNLTLKQKSTSIELASQFLIPKFDVYGDYTRNIGNEDIQNPPHIWTFGLKLEIPIERNLGTGQVNLLKSESRVIESQRQLEMESLKVKISSLLKSLELQLLQLDQAKIEFKKAKELVEAESFKFKSGGGNLFLVNVREENAATAEANFYELQFSLISTWTEFRALTNLTDQTGETHDAD